MTGENKKTIDSEKLIGLVETSLFLDVSKQKKLVVSITAHPQDDYTELYRLLKKGEEIQRKLYRQIIRNNPSFTDKAELDFESHVAREELKSKINIPSRSNKKSFHAPL